MTTYVDIPLDLAPLTVPDYERGATIDERWEAWSAANPWVLPTVEHLIADWLAAGHRRASLKQVWEVIRYEYGRTTGDRFKANNDFTSRAARAVLARHPEWADHIETRELRAA
jgi:hypothetical protein